MLPSKLFSRLVYCIFRLNRWILLTTSFLRINKKDRGRVTYKYVWHRFNCFPIKHNIQKVKGKGFSNNLLDESTIFYHQFFSFKKTVKTLELICMEEEWNKMKQISTLSTPEVWCSQKAFCTLVNDLYSLLIHEMVFSFFLKVMNLKLGNLFDKSQFLENLTEIQNSWFFESPKFLKNFERPKILEFPKHLIKNLKFLKNLELPKILEFFKHLEFMKHLKFSNNLKCSKNLDFSWKFNVRVNFIILNFSFKEKWSDPYYMYFYLYFFVSTIYFCWNVRLEVL